MTLPAEPGIDDCAEDRAEGIRHTERQAVLVSAPQLSQLQQHFFFGGAAARQRDLIAYPRRPALNRKGEAPHETPRELAFSLEP